MNAKAWTYSDLYCEHGIARCNPCPQCMTPTAAYWKGAYDGVTHPKVQETMTYEYDGRYDDVPGPLTRTGHNKAAKAALHDSLMGRHERMDDGSLRYRLPTSHEVFDGLLARGYTIVSVESDK